MKRHESLVPLSRDHHRGLVMAQRLIRGRSTAPRDPWPTDRRQQVDLLLEFFERSLVPHFDAEEAHVFPVAAGDGSGATELVARLVRDHNDMRAQVAALRADPESRLDERLVAFGETLRQHIQTEERMLFEWMQGELTSDQLDAIGASLIDPFGQGP